MVNSFQDVIDGFGGVSKFAAAVGMKPNTAKMARARNKLSDRWFAPTVAAAQERGLAEITADRLIQLAAERSAA